MGSNIYDLAYSLALGASAPFWLARGKSRKKVFSAFRQRMGHVPPRSSTGPAVMIHAVSVGELNATQALVQLVRQRRPDLHFIVSITTETGFARGQALYGSDPGITLVRFPLDFSPAIDRLLEALRPSVVALMELEVWPNFMLHCEKRNIPVVLLNGRVSTGSYLRYRRARPFVAGMFRRLRQVCAQEDLYRQRFIELGTPTERISVAGTMKFDTAAVADHVAGQDELAAAVGLAMPKSDCQLPRGPQPNLLVSPREGSPTFGIRHSAFGIAQRIWVCGSTGPGEEQIILRVFKSLLGKFPGLRLVIVPRKPERFNEVAELIVREGFPLVRRSRPDADPPDDAVVLGDTMGELRAFYSLAEVVFVGRTLVDLGSKQHGSDMIEPAALAKPTVVGPFTGNFAEVMNQFIAAKAMKVVHTEAELLAATQALLANRDAAAEMGRNARATVIANQGATQRSAEVILKFV